MKRTSLIIGLAALAGVTTVTVLVTGGEPSVSLIAEVPALEVHGPAPTPVFTTPIARTLQSKQGPQAFTERRYAPEYVLPLITKRPPPEWLTSPEAVLISLYGGIRTGDYDWVMSLFDAGSAKWQAQVAGDRETFLAAWKKDFVGHDFQLVKRHDIPGYAIVYFHRSDRAEGNLHEAIPYPLRQDASGRWWLTRDIDGHPVTRLASIEAQARSASNAQ